MTLRSVLDSSRHAADEKKLDLFQFVSRGKVEHRLRVLRFSGEERVNTAYEMEVELLAPLEVDPMAQLEDALLGNPASLVMHDFPEDARVVHGIVMGYDVVGSTDREAVRIRVKLSARLNLLKLRFHNRIFQDLTVPAVVARLLDEWRVPHAFELVGRYTPRAYLTQFHETDYDFLRRILAAEGIFFYFRQTADNEVEELIVTDDALYKVAPGMRSKITMRSGRFEVGEGDIVDIGVRRRIRPTGGRTGDYDFRNPRLPLRSLELAEDPRGVAGDLGAERLSAYLFGHGAEHEPGASSRKREEDAARLLSSLRNDGLTVRGTSRSRKLLPGHMFSLEGHSLEALNREWVVVSVNHDGQTPEYSTEVENVYQNEFEAAPVETALRMPPEVRARAAHGTQTATVVGAADGEVFTDVHGRIKVQFHWDLEGKHDDRSSCFMRVSQPWAGPGFGAQFLPRVGAEVVVTFLDGDPDRPLVVGSVYNGTHPPPFGLPVNKNKSGFRTSSTPGGEGANELSFDDEAGSEAVYLKAQRNLDVEVARDHTSTVGGNASTRVLGQLNETVAGTQTTTVTGGQITLVTLHQTTQVLGNTLEAVSGDADRRVSGDDNLRIEGTQRHDLAAADTSVSSDATTRVRGHMTAVVGDASRPTSATLHVEGTLAGYASQTTEVIAEKGIVLRCGESSIRIGPDRVEILSPTVTMSGKNIEAGADERVTMVSKDGILMKALRFHAMGKSSSVRLFNDAEIGGDRVRLNCVMDEAAILTKPRPLTHIKLTDENGAPARGRRYVIVGLNGERAGVLSDKGEAELELESDAMIYFPDVDKPRGA